MTILDQWIPWVPALSPGLGVSLSLTGLCLLFGMPFGLPLPPGGASPHRNISESRPSTSRPRAS